MRSLLLTLCGGLVLAGAVRRRRGTSPRRSRAAPAPADRTGDKAELGKSIRAYLMANPEVLVEAMQELERKQDSQRDAVAQKGVPENQAELYRDPDSPVGGNPNGDVIIVEFNDYQCPYCKRAYQAVKSAAGADGKVKIIYKDLPILGEASKIAALAALASAKQGKHQPMHNAMMEFTGKLDRDKILEIAARRRHRSRPAREGHGRSQDQGDHRPQHGAGKRARRARHARLRDRQAVRARRRRCGRAEAAHRRGPQEPGLIAGSAAYAADDSCVMHPRRAAEWRAPRTSSATSATSPSARER